MLASYVISFVFSSYVLFQFTIWPWIFGRINRCDLSVQSVKYILVWCRIPNKSVVVRFWGPNATKSILFIFVNRENEIVLSVIRDFSVRERCQRLPSPPCKALLRKGLPTEWRTRPTLSKHDYSRDLVRLKVYLCIFSFLAWFSTNWVQCLEHLGLNWNGAFSTKITMTNWLSKVETLKTAAQSN